MYYHYASQAPLDAFTIIISNSIITVFIYIIGLVMYYYYASQAPLDAFTIIISSSSSIIIIICIYREIYIYIYYCFVYVLSLRLPGAPGRLHDAPRLVPGRQGRGRRRGRSNTFMYLLIH